MTSTWHSLIWKEWHEHKWTLVSLVAVFWGTSAIPLAVFDRDMFAAAASLMFICAMPLAIFVGLGTASNERSRGTLAFAQALPIPLWRLALVKLFLGFVTLLVPILLTVGLFAACRWAFALAGVDVGPAVERANSGVITGNWHLDCLLLGVTVAASVFIWSAATGVNRKDEVSAGAVALAVMVGWYLVLFGIGQVLLIRHQPGIDDSQLFRLLAGFGLSTAPAGFVPAYAMVENNSLAVWLVIITAIAIHLALANWYVQRFGRIENIGVRSPRTAMSVADGLGWLGAPRRSAISAIVWKQARESGTLVLAGLAGVVGIVMLMWITTRPPERYFIRPEYFAEVFAGVSVSFGFGIALIVGIGVSLYDVGPQLSTFWRSRPINPDMWFWTKYLTGLVVLLGALYLPLAIVVFFVHPNPNDIVRTDEARIMPIAHIAIFATAVAMTCLVRHAVYAAILTIAVVYLGVLAGIWISLVPRLLRGLSLAQQWWEPNANQIVFGMLLSFATSTLVAWLAVRYDWGRKSRY